VTQFLNETPPLYNPAFEHDGCGTGFVANIQGERTHKLVELAILALVNLTHRGAVSADAASGDGAGITIQIPRELLADHPLCSNVTSDQIDRLAIAMVFLPSEEKSRPLARSLLEDTVRLSGIEVLGWRTVPTDSSVLGGLALKSLPGIEQLLMLRPSDLTEAEFDRTLYLARRCAEAAYKKSGVESYIVSMSSDIVVYKGLMVAPQLERFFPDLADKRTLSSLALFHQRFATNTLPSWPLAQPYRLVAHNGEINTLLGNRNWMSAREPELTSALWGENVKDLVPVISPIGSDTASLDEVLDLLITSGRDILSAMAMLIPEAWENMPGMDEPLRAFYQYHACIAEPWDGPAAIAFTDGTIAAAAIDRNGLRPARYQITSEGLVILSSEVGVLGMPMGEIVESGRVGAGEMIAVDTIRHQFLRNDDIKKEIVSRQPYSKWVNDNMKHLPRSSLRKSEKGEKTKEYSDADISRLQVLHGYTQEEIKLVLKPMILDGKEPTGSMGDDTPPSVLNEPERLLYTYFRQRFAQVTNPAIDSIREKIVMSLETYLGRRKSILDEEPEAANLLHLESPVLTNEDLNNLYLNSVSGLKVATLSACFPIKHGADGLADALDKLCSEAVSAIDKGHDALVVSDRKTTPEDAPIPMLLAISAVHHHLIHMGRRMRASILAETADARDVHHFATLIGFGASAVNPYLTFETIEHLVKSGKLEDQDSNQAIESYIRAVESGILKVMSKMGISAVSSYHGAQIFEALGLGDELVQKYFPGTTSRIGGIGIPEIANDVIARHSSAHANQEIDRGGWYKYRRNGDYHANEPPVWRALHNIVQGGGQEEYRTYSDLVHGRSPTGLRDLLEFVSDRKPIDIDNVEPVEDITSRFQTGAMSLGALSSEAHEDVARAMNIIGGLANTGEGGEDPRRYSPDGDKRDANSPVKQVASGRFGVTTKYLVGAKELEIKISQGSKPGEGGQLPGHKVSDYIASLRHVYPGTPLISPPPHHDIYSIEDIAQLIYDLKVVNPRARVCVKLVASEGVGTIAAGVAKAYADVIHISGSDGGTGASPLSSIKYAGSPWELGLAETQQTLVMNGLRGRIILTTDGGLHTGRDVVTAALLGAERFGFGTTALVAVGCKMARQCHLNTCPVGIATQREELREKYFGKPEMLVQFLTHVAWEVREILADLGYEKLEDVIGRADLLEQISSNNSQRWRDVNLSKITAYSPGQRLQATQKHNGIPSTPLDNQIIDDLGSAIKDKEPFQGYYTIRNTDRTVGGRISGMVASTYHDTILPPGFIDLNFKGSAGQSFGAWLIDGIHINLVGEANDYVAKGMNGGEIAILPPDDAGFHQHEATLVGNTILYGATGGNLFVAGRAGERFAVRNSGAHAVVEGVGDHGCEYMTRGVVVILGETGRNFGAGMSGGVAFVLDLENNFSSCINTDLVSHDNVTKSSDISVLRSLIERHHELTGSEMARKVLGDWQQFLPRFLKAAPKFTPGANESIDDQQSQKPINEYTSVITPTAIT
tara:strand:- start:591 stop:5126 length:4536 start_codon:yes stop_codon:yes gene_type:complete